MTSQELQHLIETVRVSRFHDRVNGETALVLRGVLQEQLSEILMLAQLQLLRNDGQFPLVTKPFTVNPDDVHAPSS